MPTIYFNPDDPHLQCAFCKRGANGPLFDGDGGPAYQGSTHYLFRYSTRRYAHAHCLALEKGTAWALASIPPGDIPAFKERIAEQPTLIRQSIMDKAEWEAKHFGKAKIEWWF